MCLVWADPGMAGFRVAVSVLDLIRCRVSGNMLSLERWRLPAGRKGFQVVQSLTRSRNILAVAVAAVGLISAVITKRNFERNHPVIVSECVLGGFSAI